jgi:hypothetical protein
LKDPHCGLRYKMSKGGSDQIESPRKSQPVLNKWHSARVKHKKCLKGGFRKLADIRKVAVQLAHMTARAGECLARFIAKRGEGVESIRVDVVAERAREDIPSALIVRTGAHVEHPEWVLVVLDIDGKDSAGDVVDMGAAGSVAPGWVARTNCWRRAGSLLTMRASATSQRKESAMSSLFPRMVQAKWPITHDIRILSMIRAWKARSVEAG